MLIFTYPFNKVTYSAETIEEAPVEWTFETLIPHLADKYGQNETLARSIIACESENTATATYKNLNDEGIHWSTDHGYWQINDYHHAGTTARLKLNFRTDWQDNLEYGFILLKDQGTAPWVASSHCWGVN